MEYSKTKVMIDLDEYNDLLGKVEAFNDLEKKYLMQNGLLFAF